MDLSYALDYPTVAGESPQRIHLLVRLETWPEEGGSERKPLNLALALDRSGSMEGAKLSATKKAALALVDQLTPRDIFSLVTFETSVRVVLPPAPVTDRERIRRMIESITVGSSTNLSGGWLRALALVAQVRERGPSAVAAPPGVMPLPTPAPGVRPYPMDTPFATPTPAPPSPPAPPARPDPAPSSQAAPPAAEASALPAGSAPPPPAPPLAPAVTPPSRSYLHRVLVLTDGQANLGVTDKDALMEIARQHREQDICTTTLGFGNDFNEDHLASVATEGGGHFYFIDSPDKAAATFLREFGELSRVFGQNCELSFVPGEGIPSPTVLGGLQVSHEEAVRSVGLGDVRERDQKQVLVAFDLPAGLPAGIRELVSIHVRYDAVRGKVGTRRHVLSVRLRVSPEDAKGLPPAPEVERELVIEQVGQLKALAMAKLDLANPAGARADLDAAARLLEDRRPLNPEGFDRELENLRALAAQVGQAPGLSGLRKSLAAQAHDLTSRRGTYASAPSTDVKVFSLTPESPEILDDIVDELREGMNRFGHPEETIAHLEFAARELVANGLEHGCKGQTAPRVDVELHAGRNYAKVVVRDTGKGFDFAAVLAREEQEAGAFPTGARGRGLISIKRLVDSLAANPAGNEVAASVRRRRVHFTRKAETFLSSSGVGDIEIFAVHGFLDGSSYEEAERWIEEVFAAGRYRIIVDLSDCQYMSSAGLGVFFGAIGRAQEQGGDIILVAPSPRVKEVFDLMGLSQCATFAADVEAARKHFEGKT
ncbi:MAG: anti-sigma factor antagonist [Planctomycetes bacterium]|nr:anti-sigma factor antagonist [Planctomycetota bacterium]